MVNIWTRSEYHNKKWKDIYWEEDCPFCQPKDQKWHTCWEGKYWYILHNLYPYSWNDRHLMAVPYKHKKVFLELDDTEILELREIHEFVKNFYWEQNYFSCLRETMANRSVEHLHIHFIPWKLQGKYLRKMLMDQWFPIIEKLDKK